MLPTHTELVIANFDELFARHVPTDMPTNVAPHVQHMGLWQKAVLVPAHDAYVLVAPGRPSNTVPIAGAWCGPRSVITPSAGTGQLCFDLLSDRAAWLQLLQDLRGFQKVRVSAQVHSAGLERLVESLVTGGVHVEHSGLPSVAGQTVAFWNTKIGGRDLLQRVPGLRDSLPPAVICNSLAELVTFIGTSDMRQGLVAKADSGSGGGGIWLFPPGENRHTNELVRTFLGSDYEVAQSGSILVDRGDKTGPREMFRKKRRTLTTSTGPFLVEQMVGVPGRNLSPSADFFVGADGQVDMVGIGEQLLDGNVAYRGSSGPVRAHHDQLKLCADLGCAIGTVLFRRGYRGFFNVDFVLTEAGKLYVAELNLRQSAPLDQFLIMRRLFGSDWEHHKAYLCDEAVACPLSWSLQDIASMLAHRSIAGDGEVVLPLTIYQQGDSDGENHVCLLTVAADRNAATQLADRARSTIAITTVETTAS